MEKIVKECKNCGLETEEDRCPNCKTAQYLVRKEKL